MKRTRCAVLTAVIFAATTTVSADPITVTMDGRIVLTQVDSQDLGVPFAKFQKNAGTSIASAFSK